MENAEEFERWLDKCIKDAKTQLKISNKTIAYILLREGTNYYLKQIVGEELHEVV